MAKKKRKTNPAISDPKPEASEQIVNSDEVSTAEKNEISEPAEDSDASTEPEVSETDVSEEKSAEEDEIIVSEETLAEIGEPDKELIFKKVAKAYEEAKTKREKYKKIGPIFVAASGVAFLTLIFTLENKITFLILWVITILYTVALMIRAEYKYHQFQYYLGLNEEESDSDDDTEKDDGEEDKPQSVEPEKDESPNTEQEEQA